MSRGTEPRPGGRPRDPRQIKLQVRLSESEAASWRKAADAMSIDLSTWVRSVCNTVAGGKK